MAVPSKYEQALTDIAEVIATITSAHTVTGWPNTVLSNTILVQENDEAEQGVINYSLGEFRNALFPVRLYPLYPNLDLDNVRSRLWGLADDIANGLLNAQTTTMTLTGLTPPTLDRVEDVISLTVQGDVRLLTAPFILTPLRIRFR